MTAYDLYNVQVIRSHDLAPNQAYVVGNFLVTSVKDAGWWERLIFEIREFIQRKGWIGPQKSPDTAHNTNATIGVKIAPEHYAKLLGMAGTADVDAKLEFVPMPSFDRRRSSTQ